METAWSGSILSKYYMGLIKLDEYTRLLENNFNNHYFLSPLQKASIKLNLFGNAEQLDSVKHYLALYKSLAGDTGLSNIIVTNIPAYVLWEDKAV
ncbi:MAG: hypothetical protein IPP39_05305 [Chitinophagaceae bacterium]|nr:hypothetical protein [Chitinophagaceae bacterium]